jgi:hypothetical protein
MSEPMARWGLVRGVARFASGRPAEGCFVCPEATTLPAEGVPDVAGLTNADGSYVLELPAATYTIKISGTSPSGTSLWGSAAGVVVRNGSDVTLDITVAEQQN